MIKAIETVYNGYKFRSRLEARWAVFFDKLGVKYEYEKEGYDLDGDWYLPDFWLPEHEAFIEIKGGEPTEEETGKLYALAKLSNKACFLYSGLPEKNILDTKSSPADCYYNWDGFTVNMRPTKPFHSDMNCGDDAPDDWGWHYLCPFCGCTYVHFWEPEHKECDDYSAWVGRGSAIRIPMRCETGAHTWTLRIGFHKGWSFFGIEGGEFQNTTEFLFHISDQDAELLRKAHLAAKQARFEHGETP